MTRLRCSSENEVASPVVPSTLSPSQPLASRKRASAVERALSGSPLSSIAVVMAAITPPSVFVVVMATLYRPFALAGLVYHDRGAAHAFPLDQVEQDGGVVRIEPYATVRGRSAEPRDFVSAVNGVAAMEENRIRHRRIVIEPRKPAPRHHLRVIGAGRRDVALPGGRDPPVIARHAVDADLHGLAGAVDVHDDGGLGALAKGQENQNPCGDGGRAK